MYFEPQQHVERDPQEIGDPRTQRIAMADDRDRPAVVAAGQLVDLAHHPRLRLDGDLSAGRARKAPNGVEPPPVVAAVEILE